MTHPFISTLAHILIIHWKGSETVSAAMSGLFFYLSQSPGCYQKLASEVRSAFKNPREIRQGEKLTSCRYLRACIDETLRMSPPIPATLWRTQVQESCEPVIIDGHLVPKGTEIGVNIYALHHNEKIFPEPFTFNPDRWLDDGRDGKDGIQRRSFTPFSIGPRSCPGKAVAYLEISLVMARSLWHFDFKSATGSPDNGRGCTSAPEPWVGITKEPQFSMKDRYTSSHDGPHLVFCSRE